MHQNPKIQAKILEICHIRRVGPPKKGFGPTNKSHSQLEERLQGSSFGSQLADCRTVRLADFSFAEAASEAASSFSDSRRLAFAPTFPLNPACRCRHQAIVFEALRSACTRENPDVTQGSCIVSYMELG